MGVIFHQILINSSEIGQKRLRIWPSFQELVTKWRDMSETRQKLVKKTNYVWNSSENDQFCQTISILLTNLHIYLPSAVSNIRHQLVRNRKSIKLELELLLFVEEFVCWFIFVTRLGRESSSVLGLGITVFHCCVVHYDQYKDSWNLVFVWKFAL